MRRTVFVDFNDLGADGRRLFGRLRPGKGTLALHCLVEIDDEDSLKAIGYVSEIRVVDDVVYVGVQCITDTIRSHDRHSPHDDQED